MVAGARHASHELTCRRRLRPRPANADSADNSCQGPDVSDGNTWRGRSGCPICGSRASMSSTPAIRPRLNGTRQPHTLVIQPVRIIGLMGKCVPTYPSITDALCLRPARWLSANNGREHPQQADNRKSPGPNFAKMAFVDTRGSAMGGTRGRVPQGMRFCRKASATACTRLRTPSLLSAFFR
jgi:hypothetical protein